jgi:hypothetical protein
MRTPELRIKQLEDFFGQRCVTVAQALWLTDCLLEACCKNCDDATTRKIEAEFNYVLTPLRQGDINESLRRSSA